MLTLLIVFTGLVVFSVLFVIVNHWVADFLLQTEDMATKKSTSGYWLFQHVKMYTVGMTPSAILVWILSGSFIAGILWLATNSVLHYFTDKYTSRWTSKLYALKQFYTPNKYFKFFNFPAFFSVIGLDQVIHYTCLFVTFSIYN